jgi:hypothetical protein
VRRRKNSKDKKQQSEARGEINSVLSNNNVVVLALFPSLLALMQSKAKKSMEQFAFELFELQNLINIQESMLGKVFSSCCALHFASLHSLGALVSPFFFFFVAGDN